MHHTYFDADLQQIYRISSFEVGIWMGPPQIFFTLWFQLCTSLFVGVFIQFVFISSFLLGFWASTTGEWFMNQDAYFFCLFQEVKHDPGSGCFILKIDLILTSVTFWCARSTFCSLTQLPSKAKEDFLCRAKEKTTSGNSVITNIVQNDWISSSGWGQARKPFLVESQSKSYGLPRDC